MEKRNKSREVSQDLRSKTVEKYEQSQGYKTISRDLEVPLSIVRNIIKMFGTHGTVGNFPGTGWKRKTDKRMQPRIVRMVDKHPHSTSLQIQAVLQDSGCRGVSSDHTMPSE